MNEYKSKLKGALFSRRFGAAANACLIVILTDVFDLNQDAAALLAGILCVWIIGDSIKKTDQVGTG